MSFVLFSFRGPAGENANPFCPFLASSLLFARVFFFLLLLSLSFGAEDLLNGKQMKRRRKKKQGKRIDICLCDQNGGRRLAAAGQLKRRHLVRANSSTFCFDVAASELLAGSLNHLERSSLYDYHRFSALPDRSIRSAPRNGT